ncbi:hypothetical protein GCM10011408_16850 [Dyella caseinilytica]|nr:hypothetical protein GCM10011408_16850 [Dyella caseinilytica]
MGSEAHWRDAPQDEIELALADAGIDAPMCNAILAGNIADVHALLGQQKLMGDQLPNPEEEPRPPQPDPGKEEEKEEENATGDESKAPNGTSDSFSPSSSSSL